MNDVEPDRN
jgi:hypothetical protein